MKNDFYQYLFNKQQQNEKIPSNQEIAAWGLQVISLLYPTQYKQIFLSVHQMKEKFINLEDHLTMMLDAINTLETNKNCKTAKSFFNYLPEFYQILNTDIYAMYSGDPAAKSEFEIIRAYPGFFAISLYRLAHALHLLGVSLMPRILTEFAHSHTGIDIHPAAEIGNYFFIDHGTGIVIGETTKIGNNVKLYQGVTLGALSVDKSMTSTKRHPTVEDNVIIYSGATILGGETIIGENSVIGGNVWLTKSIPPGSKVYYRSLVELVSSYN